MANTHTGATALSDEIRQRFERDGYFIVRGALQEADCDWLLAEIDQLSQACRRPGESNNDYIGVRRAMFKRPSLRRLLTWPSTFPLIAELMGPNIQMGVSHCTVRPPQPKNSQAAYRKVRWHVDGGASVVLPVNGQRPWLFTKVGFFPTDLSASMMGNLRVVPGSHRMAEPPRAADAEDPVGAIDVCTEPGDAVIFHQALWHSVGPNTSAVTRKNVYISYCYRWVRPVDAVLPSDALLENANPLERQLLGAVPDRDDYDDLREYPSEMSFWQPLEGELPLATALASGRETQSLT
jgi:ectoine hydroxylase